MDVKNILWNISSWRLYFIRGHSNWFAYIFSLLNFITISFYLLIESLTIVPDSFRLRHYVLAFVLFYTPLAMIVGYMDMKKGTYRVEQKMAKDLSPIWKELFEDMKVLREGQAIIQKKISEIIKN